MRILWSSNIVFPEAAQAIGQPASVFGGWMTSLADDVVSCGNELAVATLYGGDSLKKITTEKAVYYLIPGGMRARYFYSKSLLPHWKEILQDFKPSIIHIHGSEYGFTLPLAKAAGSIPVVVSIQGMISVYSVHYMAQIRPAAALACRTVADNTRMSGMVEGWLSFRLRAKIERRLLRAVRHVIGRTEWDYANSVAINPDLTYHLCNESLRDPFYSGGWILTGVEQHSVFTSQASYPIKGLHLLLEAVGLLKRRYPDIRLYVAGTDITGGPGKTRKRTGYGKYVRHLIERYGLEGVVQFTGLLDAGAMAARMARAHVFVLPSSIENSPNSLGEAQLVGTPCVSSYVGGVPSMATDGEDCLLYDYREPVMLADKIESVFRDDTLALQLSRNGRKRALLRHDRQSNVQDLTDIYRAITGE